MQNSQRQFRRVRLRKLIKIHTVVTALLLGSYFLAAFFDPGLLGYDLRQKYQVLADDTIAITATVLGPPEQPVVTATAQCNSTTGVLSVALDWADDTNTYTYDVDRDSLPLVAGLSVSEYTDLNVVVATTYEYTVTANGPMGPGSATSLPVVVTTPSECILTAVDPTVSIVTVAGKNIGSYDGIPRTNKRRPIFTGTTNIPSATIQVVIGTKDSVFASLNANTNGYWEWKPPVNLSFGRQTFTVTAIDPNDTTRQATTVTQFEIKKNSNTDEDTKKEIVTPIQSEEFQSQQQAPIDFALAVRNSDKTAQQGQALNLVLFLENVANQYEKKYIPFRLSIVNDAGDAVLSVTYEELVSIKREIQKSLDVPSYLSAGKYTMKAEALIDQVNVSREDTFLVTELPLIALGGGAFITYAQVVSNLGWIILILLVLLLLWLFLFLKEYEMSLFALRHVTEKNLRKAGLLAKRKGAIR